MWLTRAAEQGYANAQHNLGNMCRDGQGVPQDNVYAHMWFNISGQGDRAGVEELMTSAEITTAQNLAEECVQKDYKGCTDDGWGGWKDWILR